MVTETETETETKNYIWQSFDYIAGTQLPGMKFGRNLKTGRVTNMTSWKSVDDPSKGEHMGYWDFNGLPQIFQKKGDEIQYRLKSVYALEHVENENETYTKFELVDSLVLSKLTISPEGNTERFNWFNRTQGWFLFLSPTSDSCVRYSLCGPYGSCDIEQSPPCGYCLKGFAP